MSRKNLKIKAIVLLLIAILVSCVVYLNSKYIVFEEPIDTITVILDKQTLDVAVPIVYTNKDNPTEIDFKDVFRFQRINDSTIVINNLKERNISKFRIYFEVPGKDFFFSHLTVSNENKSNTVTIEAAKTKETIKIHEQGRFDVNDINSYVEYPYVIIKSIPYLRISIFLIVMFSMIFLVLMKTELVHNLTKMRKKDVVFILFLLSIFSFPPLYNIALILALLFYIKDFDLRVFKGNPLNILFILLFLVYLVNVVFLRDGETREFSTIERMLPMLFIPILLSSVNLKNTLYYLSLSALSICTVLFILSLIDFGILQKYEAFSFDEFARHFHPIYLSYLVFISICYFQNYYEHKSKYLFQIILFMFLIFLGSKLVLAISVPLYFMFYLDSKRKFLYLAGLSIVIIAFIVFFKPLNERFSTILNTDDLSLLDETKIENNNDSRINGLTLRLILWRETLATMDGTGEYIFGNGVTKSRTHDLEERLNGLGLTNHKSFNPHNQFMDTLWRTGFIGVYILFLIFLMAFSLGIKSKDKMLFIITLFIFISLWTESAFGRVLGVYFIPTVILVLTNNTYRKINHVKVIKLPIQDRTKTE